MNRRSFLGKLTGALAAFNILPGAGRIRKAEKKPVTPEVFVGYNQADVLQIECRCFKFVNGDLHVWDGMDDSWKKIVFNEDAMMAEVISIPMARYDLSGSEVKYSVTI